MEDAPAPSGTGVACEGAHPSSKETPMGKYFLAWLLGVPGILLVILYFFFH